MICECSPHPTYPTFTFIRYSLPCDVHIRPTYPSTVAAPLMWLRRSTYSLEVVCSCSLRLHALCLCVSASEREAASYRRRELLLHARRGRANRKDGQSIRGHGRGHASPDGEAARREEEPAGKIRGDGLWDPVMRGAPRVREAGVRCVLAAPLRARWSALLRQQPPASMR